jgi:hypothetical protein
MTESEFHAHVDRMIDAQYEALGIDLSSPGVECSEEVHALVRERFAKQVAIAVEHDPEFKLAWLLDLAMHHAREWEASRRPTGTYREDGVLPLSEDLRVFMPKATREDLLAWALRENDERNLAYIKNRLELWDFHPECETLAELENTQTL